MKASRSILWLYVLVLCAGLQSCETTIDVRTNKQFENSVFIEGTLFPDKAPRIFVSRSLPFFNKEVTPQELFARGAIVTLNDGTSTETLVADSLFDKFRCRYVPYYAGTRFSELGKTYELYVEFEGKTYTASTTINQQKATIESIEYTPEFFDIYGGHDGIKITVKDAPGESNHYRFQMNRWIDRSVAHAHVLDVVVSNCTSEDEMFMVSDFGRTIYNDDGNDGLSIEMLVEVSFEYSEGDSAWVYIQSLDAGTAYFYRELDDQLLSILNPFVEPVFIKSSVGGAIGIFGSVVLSDSVLFVYPQDNP